MFASGENQQARRKNNQPRQRFVYYLLSFLLKNSRGCGIKTKPNIITVANYNKGTQLNEPMRTQGKFTWRSKARENACDQVVAIYTLTFDWLRAWSEIYGPITNHCKAKLVQSPITSYMQSVRLSLSSCERWTKILSCHYTFWYPR